MNEPEMISDVSGGLRASIRDENRRLEMRDRTLGKHMLSKECRRFGPRQNLSCTIFARACLCNLSTLFDNVYLIVKHSCSIITVPEKRQI